MRGTFGKEVQETAVGHSHDEREIKTLLLEILERVEVGTEVDTSPEGGDNGSEVILEVSLESARYTLTCAPLDPPEPAISLSPREQEIARLVAKGLPNKAIAAVLDISPWTVATHLRRVFAKLGVSSRAEMVARVLKEDLLAEHK